MSGKALAAGIAANPEETEPVASAIPLTYFSNGANRQLVGRPGLGKINLEPSDEVEEP